MKKQTRIILKENNELEKQLTKETNDILTDMVVYIRSADISQYNQELARRDITNMLLDGQERGMTAAEVIGEDYKSFCDAVIAELPKMTKKEKLLDGVQSCCLAFGILLLIKTLFSLPRDVSRVVFSLGDIISCLLVVAVSFGIVIAICRNSFEGKSLKGWVLVVGLALLTALCIAPSLVLMETLFAVPMLIMLGVAALLLGAYKLLDI